MGMILLRTLLLSLLILTVMPWGAYVAKRGAPLPDAVSAVSAARADAPAGIEAGSRKCRTATLPGSPCGPDMAPHSGSASMVLPLAQRGGRGAKDPLVPTERQDAPPERPPRLV